MSQDSLWTIISGVGLFLIGFLLYARATMHEVVHVAAGMFGGLFLVDYALTDDISTVLVRSSGTLATLALYGVYVARGKRSAAHKNGDHERITS